MGATRIRRVGEMIRQELAGLLTGRLRDPRLRDVTITEVEMSPDLKKAHVYYACDTERAEAVGNGLEKAAGFIRKNLSKKVYLKFMPELVYHYDDSLDKGQAMDSLLEAVLPETDPEETPENSL
jgi:ribosome-binding factor A